ncbi:MAG: ABC transporter ATP-binding protein [Bacteroidia bacterium]|nr:ABC transporter ATP-binding protein [Bacteroidia bacterium]
MTNIKSSVLELTQVQVDYGKRNILRDISLSFSPGLHYLIGLNGSGKTTLFRSVCGIVPYRGSICLENQEISTMQPRQRARSLALVHQLLQVPFSVNVADFVLMGRFPYLGWMGNYTEKDHQTADTYMEQLGIAGFRDRTLDQLSGGERQKVMIARSLCQEAPVLLLDEPAQSLDPLNRDAIYQLISDLAASGKCVLCTTHDESPLLDRSARIIGVRKGEVVYDQPGGVPMEELKGDVYF